MKEGGEISKDAPFSTRALRVTTSNETRHERPRTTSMRKRRYFEFARHTSFDAVSRSSALLFVVAVVSTVLGSACSASTSPARPAPETSAAQPAAPTADADFDPPSVRLAFFKGVRGDDAELERAEKACERTLARDPHYPEALVWHGAVLLVHASRSLQQGDNEHGSSLRSQGLRELDEGLGRKPNDVKTRAPHGVAMFSLAAEVPPAQARGLLAKGIDDYETAVRLHGDQFASLSFHSRTELLFGLADGWTKLGDEARARPYFVRLAREERDSEFGERANAWLDGKRNLGPRPACAKSCHMD